MSTLTIPQPLTPGTLELGSQVQANFDAITTWAGGNVDDTNMASGYAVTPLYSVERGILFGSINAVTSMDASSEHGVATAVTTGSGLPDLTGRCVFRYDSSVYAVSGKTTNLRLTVALCTGDTAPGVDFTVALYPVSGISSGTPTLGAMVSGSDVTIDNLGGDDSGAGYASFTGPSSDNYALVLTASGTQAATSYVAGTARLSAYFS